MNEIVLNMTLNYSLFYKQEVTLMAQDVWEVTGHYHGRRLVEEVTAHTQSEARRKYERLNPDYKAGRAQRV